MTRAAQSSRGKVEDTIGYIREEIPRFEVPTYEGERYEALVEVQAVNARLRSVASLAVVDFARRQYLAATTDTPPTLRLLDGGHEAR